MLDNETRNLIIDLMGAVGGSAEQQAMHDPWYEEVLERADKFLKEN